MTSKTTSSETKSPQSHQDLMTWSSLKFWEKPDWLKVQDVLKNEKDKYVPSANLIFRPFIETPLHTVKVVLMAREPYDGLFHDPDGLAYSCVDPVERLKDLPEELVGLLRAIHKSTGKEPKSGDLTKLARRGVLLWNCLLTAPRASYGHSHIGLWYSLTTEILETLYLRNPKTIFCFENNIPVIYRKVLPDDAITFVYPKPGSAQFDSFHLLDNINNALSAMNRDRIDWRL